MSEPECDCPTCTGEAVPADLLKFATALADYGIIAEDSEYAWYLWASFTGKVGKTVFTNRPN